ncbi:MAG: hypothetical protein ACAH11_14830 [Sphingomonas sp.]
MIDDGQAKLIILAMLAIVGAIGATGFATALRTGKAVFRRSEIDRADDPHGFRRFMAARAMLLGFLALAFAAILAFA